MGSLSFPANFNDTFIPVQGVLLGLVWIFLKTIIASRETLIAMGCYFLEGNKSG